MLGQHNQDDERETVRDGEVVHASMLLMDSVQQSVAAEAVMQDATIGQRQGLISDEDRTRREKAIEDYDLKIAMSWKNPPAQVLTEEDAKKKPVSGKHTVPDTNAAYQQYDARVSDAWRVPA